MKYNKIKTIYNYNLLVIFSCNSLTSFSLINNSNQKKNTENKEIPAPSSKMSDRILDQEPLMHRLVALTKANERSVRNQ